SRTVSNGVSQVILFACSSQYPMRSAAALSYSSAVTFALAANSSGGGKVRPSWLSSSIVGLFVIVCSFRHASHRRGAWNRTPFQPTPVAGEIQGRCAVSSWRLGRGRTERREFPVAPAPPQPLEVAVAEEMQPDRPQGALDDDDDCPDPESCRGGDVTGRGQRRQSEDADDGLTQIVRKGHPTVQAQEGQACRSEAGA